MQIKKHKILFLSDTPFSNNNSLTWWRWILKLGVEKSSRDDKPWGPDTNQPEFESIFKERFNGNKTQWVHYIRKKGKKQERDLWEMQETKEKFERDMIMA